MKTALKRAIPILLVLATLFSIGWYLFIYDTDFTKEVLLSQARYFEKIGKHSVSEWFYNTAYQHSQYNSDVAIELAEQFKQNGNYSRAEYTLSKAIAAAGTVDLYIALCSTYVEQDKLLDAVSMLDNVSDPAIRQQLDQLRPDAPSADLPAGFYSQYHNVHIESGDAALYVSTDGEIPSVKADTYHDSITLVSGENKIYAVAIAENGLISPLSIFGYTIGGVIEEVTISDPALDAHVRELLGFSAEKAILSSDLWGITELTMPGEVSSYSDLLYFPYLTSLTITGSEVAGMQPLSYLANLVNLSITDARLSSNDLAVIAALPNLENLTLSNCRLSVISNLAGAHKLQNLDLSNNTIRDVSALSFMTQLKTLNLSHNALTNLSYLSALSNLEVLDVSYNSIASIVPLTSCTSLTQLNIANNSISALTGIEPLVNLTKFNAADNLLTDTSLLLHNTNLETLILSRNTLTEIGALGALNKLSYLDISYNEIAALPQWKKGCALTQINASHNQLTSVDVLGGLGNLNTVLLDYNNITSVDALCNCPNIIRVDVMENPVTNVDKLKEMKIIINYTPNI